jgi:hypothetical protein
MDIDIAFPPKHGLCTLDDARVVLIALSRVNPPQTRPPQLEEAKLLMIELDALLTCPGDGS